MIYGLESGLQRSFECHGTYEMFQELKWEFQAHACVERFETSDKIFAYKMGRIAQPVGMCLMTHKYRGSIIVLSISKSDEPNEEQKEMISGFQQGILCKH